MISGEFTINELTTSNATATPQPSPRPKRKSAAGRIAALKAAGVDVSNYFAMGDDMIVRVDDGVPSQVLDDDPVFSRITQGGYIAHSKLYRRWVMAQMFRMLRESARDGWNFTAVLQFRGYEYSWKMLEQELLAQYKMAKHGDSLAFTERNRWFNASVVYDMATDYIKNLKDLVDDLTVRHCKRRPYKRICGVNVFCDEIQPKVFAPVEAAARAIATASSPYLLYKAVCHFNRIRKALHWNTIQSKSFVDAYKGAGAYFTMKNLILFHGARFSGFPSEQQSVLRMEQLACNCEGWELLGAMKQLIADSGISIERKIAEWSKH